MMTPRQEIEARIAERHPAPEWTHTRWPVETIALLQTGTVTDLSLDHDLGDFASAPGRIPYQPRLNLELLKGQKMEQEQRNSEIEISEPHRQCASEYGYGDYYIATLNGMEYDFVCNKRGQPLTPTQRRGLIARTRRRFMAQYHDAPHLAPAVTVRRGLAD